MQSVSEIIQKQNDANNEKYLKSKHCQSNCDKCMAAGACGIWEKPAYYDGKYLVAATKVFCSKRNDCEKLSSYRSEWIEKNKKNSGLKDLLNKRINDFVASDPWQEAIKKMAVNYIADCKNNFAEHTPCNWLMFLGQSGCGKTHLCSGISNWLLEQNKRVLYVRYIELSNSISNFDYSLLERAKHAQILYLDDLFKSSANRLDDKAIFDLIDYRYNNNMQTIISCERTSQEMIDINEAVVGRIVERCNGFFFEIEKEPGKNYRLN